MTSTEKNLQKQITELQKENAIKANAIVTLCKVNLQICENLVVITKSLNIATTAVTELLSKDK